MTTETQARTVVAGIPWVEMVFDPPRPRPEETWKVDIEGIYVWVKDYGGHSFEEWRGWRIGRGGSPLLNLNAGAPFADRDAAMYAAKRIAEATAIAEVERAQSVLDEAIRALREVIVTP